MWHGHLCPPFPDSTHLILQSACLLESRCWCVLMESNWAISSVFSEQSSHSDFVLASCRIFTGSSLAFFRLTTLQPYWAAPKVCNAYIWNIRIPYSGSPPLLVHMCFISDGVWQSNCSVLKKYPQAMDMWQRDSFSFREALSPLFSNKTHEDKIKIGTLQEWPQPEEKEQRQWE